MIKLTTPDDWKFKGLRDKVSRIQELIESEIANGEEGNDGSVHVKCSIKQEELVELTSDDRVLEIVKNEYIGIGWQYIDIVTYKTEVKGLDIMYVTFVKTL